MDAVTWPGTAAVVEAVTAALPMVVRAGDVPSGLTLVTLTDLDGEHLCQVWIPPSSRIVARGARVFLHWEGLEWRQVPVVHIGAAGRPV